MPRSERTVTLQKRHLKGSRLRCLMLTSLARKQIARSLTELVQPYGVVDSDKDQWMPQGFLQSDEARLGEAELFLNPKQRKRVTDWWLAVQQRANTPNWDLVATCEVHGGQGLVLCEAKAHKSELASAGKSKPTTENGWKNHDHIGAAIEDANTSLNSLGSGWALSRDTHYQLSNRFAWTWKLASMGIPVLLVYLGFLNVDEMPDPFPCAATWRDGVEQYSDGIVPASVWESKVMVGNTPIYPIIRSLDLQWIPFGNSAREDA
jgi:hypothetical protein